MQSRTMPSLLLLCLAALGAIDAAENQTEYCAAGWELSIALDDYPPYTINVSITRLTPLMHASVLCGNHGLLSCPC